MRIPEIVDGEEVGGLSLIWATDAPREAPPPEVVRPDIRSRAARQATHRLQVTRFQTWLASSRAS